MQMNDSQIALLVRKRAALLRQRARRISLYAISAGALASGGLLAISLLYFPTGAWERYGHRLADAGDVHVAPRDVGGHLLLPGAVERVIVQAAAHQRPAEAPGAARGVTAR